MSVTSSEPHPTHMCSVKTREGMKTKIGSSNRRREGGRQASVRKFPHPQNPHHHRRRHRSHKLSCQVVKFPAMRCHPLTPSLPPSRSRTSWLLGSGVICRSVGWQREKLLYENEDRLKEGKKEGVGSVLSPPDEGGREGGDDARWHSRSGGGMAAKFELQSVIQNAPRAAAANSHAASTNCFSEYPFSTEGLLRCERLLEGGGGPVALCNG